MPDDVSLAVPERLIGQATGVVVVGSIAVGNASNYAFQVLTGRFLGADAYGALAGLMTVITIVGVSASSLQTVAARAVSAGEVATGPGPDRFLRSAVRLGVAATALFLILSPLVARFLQVGVLPLLFVAAYIVPAVIAAIALGRLQGQLRFMGMSLLSAGVAVLKLAIAGVVMVAGLGVTTLVASFAIATAAVGGLGLFLSRGAGAITRTMLDRDSGRVFIGVALFWILVSMDVPLARGFFPESTAGQYAAAAVIGRAVLWLPTVITQIVFPQVAQAVINLESTEPLMLRAFAVSIALAGGGVAGIWLLGEPMFRVLYGSEYPLAHEYAWKVALATVPFTVVNLLLHHNFARNHNRFVGVLSVSVAVLAVLLVAGPRTPTAYPLMMGLVGCATAIALLPAGGWRFFVQVVRLERVPPLSAGQARASAARKPSSTARLDPK